MLLYLLKSRCCTVGINHTVMFEPPMMAKMANMIIDAMDFDLNQVKYTSRQTKHRFT